MICLLSLFLFCSKKYSIHIYQQSFIFNLMFEDVLRYIYFRDYMANISYSKNITLIGAQHTSSHLILTSTYKLGCATIFNLQRKRMKCVGSREISNCLRFQRPEEEVISKLSVQFTVAIFHREEYVKVNANGRTNMKKDKRTGKSISYWQTVIILAHMK